jgi:hypothetical protein
MKKLIVTLVLMCSLFFCMGQSGCGHKKGSNDEMIAGVVVSVSNTSSDSVLITFEDGRITKLGMRDYCYVFGVGKFNKIYYNSCGNITEIVIDDRTDK